jgi:hypothetical protein
MKFNLLIKLALLALGLLYIGLQAFEYEIAGAAIASIGLLLLILLYVRFSTISRPSFLWFLILFTFAQIIGFVSWFLPEQFVYPVDLPYYTGNTLYILGYIYLIRHIVFSVDFGKVIRQFAGPALILLVLDVFCVYVVTDTAGGAFTMSEYMLEFVYNAVIMLLLSVALLNYLFKDSSKAMLFLIGTVFIVFSEIIQMAYFYILDSNDLSATYATFLVMAFLCLYLQSQLSPAKTFADLQKEDFEISDQGNTSAVNK